MSAKRQPNPSGNSRKAKENSLKNQPKADTVFVKKRKAPEEVIAFTSMNSLFSHVTILPAARGRQRTSGNEAAGRKCAIAAAL